MNLTDSHVVIVGGTKGIGLATARAALAAGTRVTITGRSAETVEAARGGLSGSVAAQCSITPTRPRSRLSRMAWKPPITSS